MYRPLWIEVNLRALRNNFKRIRRIVGRGVKIMATLKQEAYGHGLIPLAREFSFLGVDFFGLGSLEEAIILREKGFRDPILILSSLETKFAQEFIRYKVIPTVVDLKFAKKLNEEARKRNKIVPIHIKIDTGMGRLGIWHKEAGEFIKKLAEFKNLYLEGLFTHFPSADTDVKFTNNQIKGFNNLVDNLRKECIVFRYLHCANSIGIVNYKNSHFNLVRPGLILYGINPSSLGIELNPALSLRSKIIFIKRVEKGRSISYGRTFITKFPTTIGTVACGYADGYPWILSNRGKVIIKNKLFKVVGRVCMDHIMVNLGQVSNIKLGQEVILIGKGKNLRITVEDLANWAGTIPYEIVSRLSLKIPRIYKLSSYKNKTTYTHNKKK